MIHRGTSYGETRATMSPSATTIPDRQPIRGGGGTHHRWPRLGRPRPATVAQGGRTSKPGGEGESGLGGRTGKHEGETRRADPLECSTAPHPMRADDWIERREGLDVRRARSTMMPPMNNWQPRRPAPCSGQGGGAKAIRSRSAEWCRRCLCPTGRVAQGQREAARSSPWTDLPRTGL